MLSIFGSIGVYLARGLASASPISPVITQEGETRKFPIVQGNNLEGDSFTLPRDFGSPYNVVQLAFTMEQQYDVNTWSVFLAQLRLENSNLSSYELPTLKEYSRFDRMMIDYWMRTGIPELETRQATITLYLDVQTFIRALNLPDTQSIYTLLVDREGNIYWQGVGPYTTAQGEELLEVLQNLNRE